MAPIRSTEAMSIRNQHHRFVVHGCNNLDRFVAKRLIEPGQGDLHHLRARALNRMIDGVSAVETTDHVGVERGVFVDVLWVLRLPFPVPSPACHSLRKALLASVARIFILPPCQVRVTGEELSLSIRRPVQR